MLPINQKFELRIVKELATTASGECRERILIMWGNCTRSTNFIYVKVESIY